MQSIVDCSPSPFLAEIPPHLVEYHDEDAVVETADEAKDYFAKIKGKFA